jgi:ketosteroid isomerase-like protein
MASSERQRQNVELARRGIEAFGRSDMETVLEVLAEDVTVFSSPDLMNAGTYQGHDGFLHWTREWTDAWEGLALDVVSVEPSARAIGWPTSFSAPRVGKGSR